MSDRLPCVLLQDRQSQGADYCERERRLEERAAAAEQQVASLQALLQGTNSRQQGSAGMGQSCCSMVCLVLPAGMVKPHLTSATSSFVRCDPVTRFQGCTDLKCLDCREPGTVCNHACKIVLLSTSIQASAAVIEELMASCNGVAWLAFLSGFQQTSPGRNSNDLSDAMAIAHTLKYIPTHAMHKHL